MNKNQEPPFFIVGCDWSGIPVLKNALKLHPNLFAPEATYIYRWSEPFRSSTYARNYLGQSELKTNWLQDGFTRGEMTDVFEKSISRQSMSNQYGRRFLKNQRVKAKRWFDATPENIYGLLLLRSQFPKSKIVYVYKNAFEVIASLMHSPSSEPLELDAAVNHWLEAMQIISVFKQNPKSNLIEIKYESFVAAPKGVMRSLLSDLGEDPEVFDYSRLVSSADQLPKNKTGVVIRKNVRSYATLLSDSDLAFIIKHCKRFLKAYDYNFQKEKRASESSQLVSGQAQPNMQDASNEVLNWLKLN